jgi:hypothetical protein
MISKESPSPSPSRQGRGILKTLSPGGRGKGEGEIRFVKYNIPFNIITENPINSIDFRLSMLLLFLRNNVCTWSEEIEFSQGLHQLSSGSSQRTNRGSS